MTSIHIHIHDWTQRWFFSTSHTQPGLSSGWVPVTYSWRTWTRGQVILANNPAKQIPNPDPAYEPQVESNT